MIKDVVKGIYNAIKETLYCPLAFGEVGVKSRVKSVLNYKTPAFWLVTVALFICAILGLFFLTVPEEKVEAIGYENYEEKNFVEAQESFDKALPEAEDIESIAFITGCVTNQVKYITGYEDIEKLREMFSNIVIIEEVGFEVLYGGTNAFSIKTSSGKIMSFSFANERLCWNGRYYITDLGELDGALYGGDGYYGALWTELDYNVYELDQRTYSKLMEKKDVRKRY